MTNRMISKSSKSTRLEQGIRLAVLPLLFASLLAVGCTPGRIGGPRVDPIPAGLMDRMDYGSPFAETELANVDNPYRARTTLGNDEKPRVTVGQSALMVGLFVAASALCSGGSCRLP